MRLMNISVAIILISVLSVQANIFTKNSRTSHPPTLLDVLRTKYFSIEDALWHVISSGLEQSYVLQQIHSGHRTFLRDDFSEKSCYFSTFDPDQQVLLDAIKKINESVTTTVTNYLHTGYYRESDSLAISIRNMNLTHQLDKIFEVAGNSDFYMTVRNVSSLFVYLFFLLRISSFCWGEGEIHMLNSLINSLA